MRYWLGVHRQDVYSDPRGDRSRIAWPAKWQTTVAGIERGDRIIMYVTRLQRFHAAYEVTEPRFPDDNYHLAGRSFPECVRVREVAVRRPEDGIAVSAIRGDLEIFKKLRNPKRWSSIVRKSISELDEVDGETILRALQGTR
jgi:hypothetical protein